MNKNVLKRYAARLSPVVLLAAMMTGSPPAGAQGTGPYSAAQDGLNAICTDYAHILNYAQKNHVTQKAPAQPETMLRAAYNAMVQSGGKGFRPDTAQPSGLYTDPKAQCMSLAPLAQELEDKLDVEPAEAFTKALDGVIRLYDRYSRVFSNGAENALLNHPLEAYSGSGIRGFSRSFRSSADGASKGWVVTGFEMPGSPAEKADIAEDDIIFLINGAGLNRKSDEEIRSLLRGQEGKKIEVAGLRHNGGDGYARFDTTITFGEVIPDPVQSRMIPESGDTALVRIDLFNQRAADSVYSHIRNLTAKAEAQGQKLKKVVLDLRTNMGGYADQAASTADFFIEKTKGEGAESLMALGKLAPEEVYARVDEKEKRNLGGLEVVVLTGAGTASGAELLAGNLKQAGHKVVGRNTHGKETWQQITNLKEKLLHLDVTLILSEYYYFIGPEQRTAGVQGITPNVAVRTGDIRDEWDMEPARAADWDGAVVWPGNAGREPEKSSHECRLNPSLRGELSRKAQAAFPGYLLQDRALHGSFVDAHVACALAWLDHRDSFSGKSTPYVDITRSGGLPALRSSR